MIAYLFPGQGSQHKGMGKEVFDEFRDLTMKTDKILGYSIKELCLEDPENKLGKTQYTQPALYVVNAFSYMKKIKDTGIKPNFVAGHSLGEYNALFASGVIDFESGLRLVKKRGELMARVTEGGMAAIIGLQEDEVQKIIVDNNFNEIDIANLNSPTQIVISGSKKMIEQAKPFFEQVARAYIILNVSGAFHSRYMESARNEFYKYASEFEYYKIKIPIISNVLARPYKQQDILDNLAKQITNSVKWSESIRYLMGKDVKDFVQVGPGNVINGLVKTIIREAEPLITSEEDYNKESNENVIDEPKYNNLQSFEEKEYKRLPLNFTAKTLGNMDFKKDYDAKYSYVIGAMYKGVASKEMVIRAGKAGMLSFFGTGGLDLFTIEKAIKGIQEELGSNRCYGMNFLHNPNNPQLEEELVDLFLKYNIENIEASAFMSMTTALVRYKIRGLRKDINGNVISENKIIAKVSRPEIAEKFLSPAPERILNKLIKDGAISHEEAILASKVPIADDLCVEADSGGHTDCGVAYVLIPAMMKLRDKMMKKYKYLKKIRVGAAGGIGTGEAVASAFMLGADFIVTGSINQCTPEAGTSNAVKELLQQMNVQDTDYAPAGDMFEIGAKVQVLKRGVFFSVRASKLYDLYKRYNSLDEIDEKVRVQIQEKYFKKSFEDVYEDVKKYYGPEEIQKAEKNSKHKMALIFRWYFGYSTGLALSGNQENKVDYQIHCGPSLGAFNQWVKGTELEHWNKRNVDIIGIKLMNEAANYFNKRFAELGVCLD